MKYFVILLIHLIGSSGNLTLAQTTEIKHQIQANIDWMWGEEGRPTRMTTYTRKVPIGNGKYGIRGYLSAKSCVVYATLFALANEQDEAIEWLQAGQDHNIDVQDQFAEYPNYCIEYLKARYSSNSLKLT